MANRSLGSLTLDLIARIGGFTGPLNKAAREAQKESAAIAKSLSKITGAFSSIGTGIAGFVTGIATAALSLNTFFKALDTLDRLDELAAKTGISTEELSKLGYAAKLSGADLEDLNTAFDKLAKNAVKALDPTSKQAEIFKALGVSVTDLEGNLKSSDQLLKEVSTGFKQLNDDTLEAAAAQELFGKSGAGLLEFLNLGADGLERLGNEASSLGGVFDQETAAAAAELKDEFDKLLTVGEGLIVQFIKPILPLLKEATAEFKEMGVAASGAGGNANKAGGDVAELLKSITDFGSGSIKVLEGVREVLNGLQDQATAYTKLIFGVPGQLEKIRASGDRIAGAFDGPPARGQLPTYLDTPQFLSSAAPFRATDARFSAIPQQTADEKKLAEAISGTADAKKKDARATRERNKETEEEKRFREEILEINELIDEQAQDSKRDLFFDSQRRKEDQASILADLEFEKALLGQTADEQERLNLLRYAGVDAASEEAKVLEESLRDLQERREVISDQTEAMDALREGFSGFLNDLKEGKSLTDSLKDAFDGVLDTIFQIVAQNLAESLFGQQGSTSGGSGGGWFAQLAGLFFGGGRANGGGVSANGLYEVNERGTELLTVGNRSFLMMGNENGKVTPAGQFGGSIAINNTYINPQMADPRSESQRRQREAEQLRVATGRNG